MTVRQLIGELARTEEELAATRLEPLTPEVRERRRTALARQARVVGELRRRRGSVRPAA